MKVKMKHIFVPGEYIDLVVEVSHGLIVSLSQRRLWGLVLNGEQLKVLLDLCDFGVAFARDFVLLAEEDGLEEGVSVNENTEWGDIALC